jgi:pimeloyl-ACP methyl ester carboxylesterase
MSAGDLELVHRTTERTPVDVALALWAPLFEFTPDELGQRSDALMAALADHPSLSIDHEDPPGYYETLHWFAPNAHTKVVECGHWIHVERPAEFRAALREFLAGV